MNYLRNLLFTKNIPKKWIFLMVFGIISIKLLRIYRRKPWKLLPFINKRITQAVIEIKTKNKLEIETLNNIIKDRFDIEPSVLPEKGLDNDTLIKYIETLKTLYDNFKEDYNTFSDSFNIFKQINKNIKEKENKYLILLDELNNNINNEEANKKIQLTNGILDLLIDYDSIIYKMNNGYEVVDVEKLNTMLEKLSNL